MTFIYIIPGPEPERAIIIKDRVIQPIRILYACRLITFDEARRILDTLEINYILYPEREEDRTDGNIPKNRE